MPSTEKKYCNQKSTTHYGHQIFFTRIMLKRMGDQDVQYITTDLSDLIFVIVLWL